MSKKVQQVTERVYHPKAIPDSTEELLKLSKEANQHKRQEILEDSRRRDDARSARILASKQDKSSHAVDLIIEYGEAAKNSQTTQYADNGTTFSIPYYFFNFEDVSLFKSFLNKLKFTNCFESWSLNPYKNNDNTEIFFRRVDTPSLIRFKESMGIVRFPVGETVIYQNSVLFFKMGDGTTDSIDFSNAPVWKQILESFLALRKRAGETHFTPVEVMNMHNQLFGKAIERRYLAQQMSNIRNKKIKNELKERFKIGFDKPQNAWIFTLY